MKKIFNSITVLFIFLGVACVFCAAGASDLDLICINALMQAFAYGFTFWGVAYLINIINIAFFE